MLKSTLNGTRISCETFCSNFLGVRLYVSWLIQNENAGIRFWALLFTHKSSQPVDEELAVCPPIWTGHTQTAWRTAFHEDIDHPLTWEYHKRRQIIAGSRRDTYDSYSVASFTTTNLFKLSFALRCQDFRWFVDTCNSAFVYIPYLSSRITRVRPIPEFTDTTDTDTLDLHRYRVPIPIPVVMAQRAWRKCFHAIMREHAAGLLKHSKNVTWSKTGGGVRTRHHRTVLFLGCFFTWTLTLTGRQFTGGVFLRG